jgi:hypothetical protein
MKLIAAKKGKTDKYDQLRCVRRDGSETSCPMPRQGILPHDLVHYVVETGMRWHHGFLGQVAAGRDIGFAMEYAHDPANREAADQVIQAEAMVESLQAQLWGGAFDAGMFMEGLRGACAVRGRDVPDLSGIDLQEVLYRRAVELGARWQQVPFHGSLELEMEHV